MNVEAGGTAEELATAQRALRARWVDFRGALDRRDDAAYRMAFQDFATHLRRWMTAEERILVAALARAPDVMRDAPRELKVEIVQIRELTRFLLEQFASLSPLADILGLVDNLDRRMTAHEDRLISEYFPGAVVALTAEDWTALREAAPAD
ncbi:MAG: hypothetical protein M3167_01250 [Acidobacteriota bacterium]|nr:hypothetical protein [Acidobacteriota bacterium]